MVSQADPHIFMKYALYAPIVMSTNCVLAQTLLTNLYVNIARLKRSTAEPILKVLNQIPNRPMPCMNP